MATLETLYCSVVLQSLTFLKIMRMAAHQSKMQGLALYTYVWAPARAREHTDTWGPASMALRTTLGRGWRPAPGMCQFSGMLTLFNNTTSNTILYFLQTLWIFWLLALMCLRLLQLIFLGDASHHLSCIKSLYKLLYIENAGQGSDTRLSNTLPRPPPPPPTSSGRAPLPHGLRSPCVCTASAGTWKCHPFALFISHWFWTGLLSLLRWSFSLF